MTEIPMLTVSTLDRVIRRQITEDDSAPWQLSHPLPGTRIINTWRIYQGIQIVLSVAENGKYNLFRTIDYTTYSLVHSHDTEIYNLFFVDDGFMLFSATDGWWVTTNSGMTWAQFSETAPSKSAVAVAAESYWCLLSYGIDRVIRRMEYPDGEWVTSLDTSVLWSNRWYPVIAGSPVAVVVGVGPYIYRSTEEGAAGTWALVQEVDGIVKSISVSDQGTVPTFLVEVEDAQGERSCLYLSYDVCDSLELDTNRVDAISDVQSVYPTGEDQRQTRFAVLGRRFAGGPRIYHLIEESRS